MVQLAQLVLTSSNFQLAIDFMTATNTDKAFEYGRPYNTDFHDEFEVDFHAAEGVDEKLETKEEWQKRHTDRALEFYCDTHPSAPECKVYDD